MRSTPPQRPRLPRRRAITLVELLIVVVVLVLITLLLIPAVHAPCVTARGTRCQSNVRQLMAATVHYTSNYGGYFPVAWGVGGEGPADLAHLRYWRALLVQGLLSSEPYPTGAVADAQRFSSAGLSRGRGGPDDAAELWTCPQTSGWTRDYFAGPLLFRLPDDGAAAPEGAVHLDELSGSVPHEQRPVLADVNASFPTRRARDRDDPGHQAEMRQGFSIRWVGDTPIYVGVGDSLRDRGDWGASRLDFRHHGKVAVAFLDGHTARLAESAPALLRRLHRRWNSLTVAAEGS
jgi:hypothetical protein